jgi:hypothetical protein
MLVPKYSETHVIALIDAVDSLIDQLGGDKNFCVYCGDPLEDSWGDCNNPYCSYPPLREALAKLSKEGTHGE